MKKLLQLLAAAWVFGVMGCGKAEIERLKAENEAAQRQLNDERSKEQANYQRLKEAEDRFQGLKKLLEERPTLVALEAERQKTRNLEEQRRKDEAEFNAKQAAENKKFKKDVDEARKEGERVATERCKTESKEEKRRAQMEEEKVQKELEAEKEKVAVLKKQVEKAMNPNASVVQKPEAYKTKDKTLVIGFRPGKDKQAELLCKALGLVVLRVDGEDRGNRILCQWQEEITAEALHVLSSRGTVIRYVHPVTPLGGNSKETSSGTGGVSGSYGTDEAGRVDGRLGEETGTVWDDYMKRRWALSQIHAPAGWGMVRGSGAQPIVVAVIDFGFDTDHPDLKGHLTDRSTWRCFDSRRRNEGNDVSPDYQDKSIAIKHLAHGTHCAGIIVSIANHPHTKSANQIRILPIKVTTIYDIPDAIRHAVRNGARVISLSMCEDLRNGYYSDWADAIKEATDNKEQSGLVQTSPRKRPALLVCAAGNKNLNVDLKDYFIQPGGYGRRYPDGDKRDPEYKAFWEGYSNRIRADRIITVGAVGRNRVKSGFSNHGKITVDIMAPGGNGLDEDEKPGELRRDNFENEIYSMIPSEIPTDPKWNGNKKKKYGCMSGTSQAVPYVAGAAAMIWSHPKFNNLPPEVIKRILVNNSVPQAKQSAADKSLALQIDNVVLEDTRTNGELLQTVGLFEPEREGQDKKILDLSFLEEELRQWRLRNLALAAGHFGRGQHYYWENRHREAIVAFNGAIALDPGNAAYYYFSSFCWACLGDKTSATENLTLALELEKRGARVRNWGELVERLQGPRRRIIETARTNYNRDLRLSFNDKLWDGWDCTASAQQPIVMSGFGHLPCSACCPR